MKTLQTILLLALTQLAMVGQTPAPLTSTLADLTCTKLEAYYAPPTPGHALVSPSTDPSVYASDPSYLKQLNEQAFQRYTVDQPNANAAARYDFACKTWEAKKSAVSLPPPPVYSVLSQIDFDAWWRQVNAHLGENAPPLFFIKPVPALPDPVIGQAVTPLVQALDGPIGSAVPGNPGVFTSSATDNYPDGAIYVGRTGAYQKHIYSNPFTSGHTRVLWLSLQ